MAQEVITEIIGNDLQIMESLLADGHIEHKYAVQPGKKVLNKRYCEIFRNQYQYGEQSCQAL